MRYYGNYNWGITMPRIASVTFLQGFMNEKEFYDLKKEIMAIHEQKVKEDYSVHFNDRDTKHTQEFLYEMAKLYYKDKDFLSKTYSKYVVECVTGYSGEIKTYEYNVDEMQEYKGISRNTWGELEQITVHIPHADNITKNDIFGYLRDFGFNPMECTAQFVHDSSETWG